MSKMMVKRDGLWTPMANLKGDTGPLPADNSVTNDALVTDGAKTNTAYLMGNRLTAATEGEMVSVDDSYPSAALSLTVDGKSTQVTTTGKNLLDESNNIVRGYFYDSTKKIEGWGTSIYAPVTEGATYTLSGGNGNRYVVAYTDVLPAVNAPLIAHASAQKTFTVPTGARYVVFYIDSSSTLTPSGYQLEAGSSATAYEPYTGGKASPNPDYPQEIVSVNELVLMLAGRNMLDLRAELLINQGLTASGVLRDVRTDRVTMGDSDYTPIVGGETYTVFLPNNWQCVGNTYNSSKEHLGRITTSWMASGDTFVAPSGAEFLRFMFRRSDDSDILPSEVESSGIILAAPTSLTILSQSLRSLPDGTKDELHLSYLRPSTREGFAWYSRELVKRVSLRTFNGTENWNSGGSSYNGNVGTDRFTNVSGMRNTGGMSGTDTFLSEELRHSSNYIWSNPDVHIWKCARFNGQAHVVFDNATVGIRSEAVEANRTALIKAWLAENPITLHYPLATPTTETLDPIELPIMQAGITNIWTDPSTSLSVTYERDRNIVISKLEAAAADLATS